MMNLVVMKGTPSPKIGATILRHRGTLIVARNQAPEQGDSGAANRNA